MTLVRRAAVSLAGACVVAGALALGGCTPPRQEAVVPPAPAAPSADVIESLRARYAAAGNLVGRVDAVNADAMIAAVAGIDLSAAGNDSAVFTYIDPASDSLVNNGTMAQKTGTPSGLLVVSFDPQGQRAPQVGDLVVRHK